MGRSFCAGRSIYASFGRFRCVEPIAKYRKRKNISSSCNFKKRWRNSIKPNQIKFNKWAYTFAKEHMVKCISTCDVHYLKKEHHDIHKAFLTSREADRGEEEDFYATTYMMNTEEKREYFNYKQRLEFCREHRVFRYGTHYHYSREKFKRYKFFCYAYI